MAPATYRRRAQIHWTRLRALRTLRLAPTPTVLPVVMIEQKYKPGDILFQEGEKSRYVYRLTSGAAEIFRRGTSGDEVIGRIQPGEFVGEMGVLVASERGASARFTADSVVERFTRVQFLDLIARDPALSSRMLHALSLRTRSQVALLEKAIETRPDDWRARYLRVFIEAMRATLKSVPLAKAAEDVLTAPGLVEKTFPKGSRLFLENEISESVFWIRAGRIEVVKTIEGRERRVGFARKREFIGEMGVLESSPRSATAVAVTEVRAVVLTPARFFELMAGSPAAYLVVVDSLCERARRLRRRMRSTGTVADAQSVFDVARSMDSVTQLAEQRLVDETMKMRRFFNTQVDHGKFIAAAYQKYLRGEASKEEMEQANAYFRDYIKIAGIGTLIVLPGSPLTIPLAVKIGKALGIDILPNTGAPQAGSSTKRPDLRITA